MKCRLLLDHVALAEELDMGFNQKNTLPRVFLCLDITKVFNSIHWSMIVAILESLDFSGAMVRMLTRCFATASFLVLIDASQCKFFHSKRGLRHGLPLSPPTLQFGNGITILEL